MSIILNGVTTPLEATEVSYEEIVKLAGETGYPTVAYSTPRRGDIHRSGEMHTGCAPVKLEDGMIFSVIHTGNA